MNLQVAETLKKFGILYIKDSRVKEQYNQDFLDMLEQYFEQISKFGQKLTLKSSRGSVYSVEKASINYSDKIILSSLEEICCKNKYAILSNKFFRTSF